MATAAASLAAACRRATPSLLRRLKPRTPTSITSSPTALAAALSTTTWEEARQEWWQERNSSNRGRPASYGWATAVAAAAAAAGMTMGLGTGTGDRTRDVAKNCGIVGVVSSSEKGNAVDPVDFLFEGRTLYVDGVDWTAPGESTRRQDAGLSILRNRGYDSAGVATIDADKELVVSKFASRRNAADSMELLKTNKSSHNHHTVGIAHTRWATHGGRTDKNAHPHMDFDNRIALVHNGTINNAMELRKELQDMGVEFRSETDSEVGGDEISQVEVEVEVEPIPTQ